LKINNNVSLSTLNGLESIDPASISSLVITSNSTLSDCAVQSLCDYLSDGTGSSSISSNNMGCNSDNQILSACISLGLDEFVTDGFTFYPNPAKDILYISSTTHKKVDRISIFSQLWQEVLKSDNSSTIDISSLPSGMYLIEIQSDGQKMRSKIMIE
jgi:hypothetical protein